MLAKRGSNLMAVNEDGNIAGQYITIRLTLVEISITIN